MITRRRRRLGWLLLAVLALGAGVGAAIAAAAGDTERVTALWISAEVVEFERSPVLRVTEVIDYDFGANSRRGIFRDVPDIPLSVEPAVSSPTAPDQFVVEPVAGATRIRIGDPDVTITGRHRYQISYPLEGAFATGDLAYDAVGTFWEVPISEVEVHLTAPVDLEPISCDVGGTGDRGGCVLEVVEPGHLRVRVDELGEGRGVTLRARPGARLGRPPATPPAPSGPASDPGSGLVGPAVAAALAALLGAFPAVALARRAGREQAVEGAAADVAFADHAASIDPGAVKLVDSADLSQLATVEFAPPRGVTAAQGGVLLHEKVLPQHATAWLLNQAIFGVVSLDTIGDDPVLRRSTVPTPLATDQAIIDTMFGGRHEVTLDGYDATFASGWKRVGQALESWLIDSPLWCSAARSRKRKWALMAALAVVVGVLVGGGSAAFANRSGGAWLVGVLLGFAVAGFGAGLAIRNWELMVRTPTGTAVWLRTLSFKRFLAESEAHHVEWAAQHGMLREYTAWAVALGEAAHWAEVIERSQIGESGVAAADAVHFATLAPRFTSATSTASTAPSSSGGGGGGVGGGAGGGGGGSW